MNYNTHFKMRNFLFTTRLDYDITGTAYSTVLWIAFALSFFGFLTFILLKVVAEAPHQRKRSQA